MTTIFRERQLSGSISCPQPPEDTRATVFTVRGTWIAADLVLVTTACLVAGFSPIAALAAAVLTVMAISGSELYRPQLMFDVLGDAPTLWFHTGAIVLGVKALTGAATPTSFLTAAAIGLVPVVGHAGVCAVVRTARRRRIVSHPALIVGVGGIATEIATRLEDHPELGLRPFGPWNPTPGGADLRAVLEATKPAVVVLAFPDVDERELVTMIRACDRIATEIMLVPPITPLVQLRSPQFDRAWDIPLIRLRRLPYRSSTWRFKRWIDVATAMVVSLVVAPVALLCALAVLVENGRPLLFRQERVGLDGRRFRIVKFRTLPHAPAGAHQWNAHQVLPVRPLSRLMRRLSLDELPQLWNVLRGDMSMVGPRPERPEYVAEFSHGFAGYRDRHRVPCGLTGLAQIHGLRGDTSMQDRIAFDNMYIESWSIATDLLILLRTPWALLTRPGR